MTGIALAVESGPSVGDMYGVAISLFASLGLALNLTILRHHRNVNSLALGILCGLITGTMALFSGDPSTITGQSLIYTITLCFGLLPAATALFLLGPRYAELRGRSHAHSRNRPRSILGLVGLE